MPALLIRLLLSALLILNGSAGAWAAAAGLPVQAVAHNGHTARASISAHCADAATARGYDALVAAHEAGHTHHAAAQPDCDGGRSCNHACHMPAPSAAALPASPLPVGFERGQDLYPDSGALLAAPPPHQPIRPPIC